MSWRVLNFVNFYLFSTHFQTKMSIKSLLCKISQHTILPTSSTWCSHHWRVWIILREIWKFHFCPEICQRYYQISEIENDDLPYCLHECRVQYGPSIETDGFSEKSLILNIRGLVGRSSSPKIDFVYFDDVASSFFFPKLSHMSLNYRYILFYKHFLEGSIRKYRENRTLQFLAWNDLPGENYKSDLAKFVNIGRYQGDTKPLCKNFWNFNLIQLWRSKISNFVQNRNLLYIV